LDKKIVLRLKIVWVFAMIAFGLLLNHFGLGIGGFAGYPSVGTYLLYIGILGLAVIGLAGVFRKRKVRDERMEFVAAKAMRATFLVFVLVAFALMVLDGIQPIAMPYHLFLSYLVCGMLAVMFVSYRIMLRLY